MLDPIVINKDSVIDLTRQPENMAVTCIDFAGEVIWTNKDGFMEAKDAE